MEQPCKEARATGNRRWMRLFFVPVLGVAGCMTPDAPPSSFRASSAPPGPVVEVKAPAAPTINIAGTLPNQRPAYGQLETLPIDLPTVLRMVDSQSPTIGMAQARAREAEARYNQAQLQWLPNISFGTAYTRFDGQTQNQRGEIFDVSRANLFTSGGGSLNLDVAEAIYRPLIERRVSTATHLQAQAITLGAELEATLAYWDLVQAQSLLAINADTLEKAESMLQAAKNAQLAKLDRSAGDVNRASAEVLLRRTERAELHARASAAGARLGRLLLLPPNVTLLPTEMTITPITMIDPQSTLDHLLTTAINNRPDLAANREALAAAWKRVHRQTYGPLLPKVGIVNQAGRFGGGINDDLSRFADRNALSAQLFWELKNFGLGNLSEIHERQAAAEQVRFQMLEQQARVAAEIVELAQSAAAKYETLQLCEQAVKEANELYRISKEGTLNAVDAKNLFDALRPLQAIQVLNQAKQNYLSAILDFNRSQFRLYVALGRPPHP